jgi:RHS repeat-associated protein
MISPSIPKMLFGASADAASFLVAANQQLAENSRPGSESNNRTLAPGCAAVKSPTVQWTGWHLNGRTASGPSVYLYDGARLIEEADGSGNILARYAHSTEVDEPLSMLRGTVASYYQNDGIGSITSLSNQTAVLAGTYTFDSFGKLTASTGSITNPFRYTGREFDAETGVYYYRARYFDPGTGRFVSEDPIRFGGDGPDFYAYVNNDPTDFTDPLGLCCDVPAHPPDVNVEYNMSQAQTNGYRWWFNTVGQWGGPWDYKNWGGQKHPEWDDFGNFNAGATACALHFPLWITLRGAGWAKQRRMPNDPDGNWWGTWPYGNDAHKQSEVMAGWNWCHDGCADHPDPTVGAAPLPGPSFSVQVEGGGSIPIEW